jgi:F0F1-type ATP synthase delta subunit
MKYPVAIYAKALSLAIIEAGPAGEDGVVRNFTELLRKNGDGAGAKKIIKEAWRVVRAKQGLREVVLESARPLSEKHGKSLRGFAGPKDAVVERVNVELIAGVRIVVNDEREFDGSLQGKLNKLFGNI